MTFSYQVKKEIMNKQIDNDCCVLARLTGIVKAIGSLIISRGKFSFSAESDDEDVLSYMIAQIKKRYGVAVTDVQTNSKNKGAHNYKEVELPSDVGQDVLFEVGAIERNATGNIQIVEGLENVIVKEDCCKKSFLAGLFLGCGTISTPTASGSGYHFEFECSTYMLAHDAMNVLAELDFVPRMVERKDSYVVYFKESDAIFGLLVMMGATTCAFELQNNKVQRDIKNNINRLANCKTANAEKTVNSSVKDIMNIQIIAEKIGLDTLDPRLRIVADARLNYPELSLNDLLAKIKVPITKSGLRYRLEKLNEIAKELNGG